MKALTKLLGKEDWTTYPPTFCLDIGELSMRSKLVSRQDLLMFLEDPTYKWVFGCTDHLEPEKVNTLVKRSRTITTSTSTNGGMVTMGKNMLFWMTSIETMPVLVAISSVGLIDTAYVLRLKVPPRIFDHIESSSQATTIPLKYGAD